MKKIQYLSILLCLVLIACNKSDTEPISADFAGTWSGALGCSVQTVSVSFDVTLNIQADDTRCDHCYTVGLSMQGSADDTVLATEIDGELVFDNSSIDLGDMDGIVRIEGTCRKAADGRLEFDLAMVQVTNGNFGYTCTSMLSRQ